MSKKLIISLLTLSLLPGTALSQNESSLSNQIIIQENSQENSAEILNYLNITKMCSDVSTDAAEFGTVIVGLSVANSVCANVSEISKNGYKCVQPILTSGSWLNNGRVEYYYAKLGDLRCSKESSGGTIEVYSNFQFSTELTRNDVSVVPKAKSYYGYKEKVLDVWNLNENFLISFAAEAKDKHLSSTITKVKINCNTLNSCSATNRQLADALVNGLPSISEMQIFYDKTSGITEFGEKITIEGSPEDLNAWVTIERGNLDSYRPGGITLD